MCNVQSVCRNNSIQLVKLSYSVTFAQPFTKHIPNPDPIETKPSIPPHRQPCIAKIKTSGRKWDCSLQPAVTITSVNDYISGPVLPTVAFSTSILPLSESLESGGNIDSTIFTRRSTMKRHRRKGRSSSSGFISIISSKPWSFSTKPWPTAETEAVGNALATAILIILNSDADAAG